MLNCIIVDDEPLARECLAGYISKIDFLNLAGEVSNPLELSQLIAQQPAQLIFLDIQTPVINGIDFLRMTSNLPMVIITTAYPSFALEGFQLDVLDYLVKPITFDRFLKASSKANDYFKLSRNATLGNTSVSTGEDFFFIKCDSKYEKIYFRDIIYIQALENYVNIFTTKRKYLTLLSLKSVGENLNNSSFMRVHKSYIVAIDKIDAIENSDIIIQSNRIPVSRNYKEEVIERVVNKRLWKK